MTDFNNDLTPEEALDQAKRAIQTKINAQKNLILAQKKKIRALEKLELELHPDKLERLNREQSILTVLQTDLGEFELDLKELTRTRDDETEEKIQAALNYIDTHILQKDPTCGYIIKDKEFVTIVENSTIREKQNVTIDRYDPNSFIQLLAAQTKLKSWHLPIPRVIDLFNSKNRSYKTVRYTIDSPRWGQDVYSPIAHMRKYFIDQMELTPEEEKIAQASVHYFDWLMYSLSGGRDENKEHIERWLIQKVINYNKAVTTPDLVIVGHVGGNGKGILQAIVRIMLPAILSGNANTKTLTNNFNAIMLGKLIVFFDDQVSKEIPLDVVKQLAGSDTMIFEEKGKDQYNGEKTHSSAWFAQQLPFRLTPAGQEGGVDRRFSIMRTNITFLESIRRFMEEETGQTVTIEESKDLAEIIVSTVLLNRVCIAYWFRQLLKKYPDQDRNYVLKALHGEDYRYFLDQQRDKLEEIFRDLVVPVVEAGGAVPMIVIREILRLSNEPVPHDRILNKKLSELASQNKIEVVFGRRYIDITGHGTRTKIQNAAVIKKGNTDSSPEFDWSLVSRQPFKKPGKNEEYISDENFIFGVKNVSDDWDFEDLVDSGEEEVELTPAEFTRNFLSKRKI
jgi:hypothetical protein